MTNTAPGGAAPTASPTDTDNVSLTVIALSLVHKAIVDRALEVEGFVPKAKTLSLSSDASKNIRDLAQAFVGAHRNYQSRLSNYVIECRDTTDAEKRRVGWNLGPLLGTDNPCITKAPVRIANEFLVQAHDPSADRFFDERASGYDALKEALAAKATAGQRESRQGFFSSLLSFGRS
jgi:hypothetical protein